MLEVCNITKIYKQFQKKSIACKDISFTAKEGEIVSLLGLNGAGKSTIIKIITGVVRPTIGDVIVEGHSINNSPIEAKREMGVLYENAPLYNELTVEEFLMFSIQMRAIGKKDASYLAMEALEMGDLLDVKNKKIATLSKGYRQRVAFASILAHRPRVLILDEPTANLDSLQLKAFEKRILQLDKTKIALISTHNLDLAKSICTKHILLKDGEVILQGSIEEIKTKIEEESGEISQREDVLARAFELFAGVKKSEFFKG